MRKNIVSIFFVFFALLVSKAQGVTINEDPTITKMMEVYAVASKSASSSSSSAQVLDGYRIQLAATTDRRKVDQMMSSFSARYQGVPASWTQVQPYYRVRVGAFSNRDSATKYLQTIKKDYPDAYIVTDKVKTTEVMSNY